MSNRVSFQKNIKTTKIYCETSITWLKGFMVPKALLNLTRLLPFCCSFQWMSALKGTLHKTGTLWKCIPRVPGRNRLQRRDKVPRSIQWGIHVRSQKACSVHRDIRKPTQFTRKWIWLALATVDISRDTNPHTMESICHVPTRYVITIFTSLFTPIKLRSSQKGTFYVHV